MRPTATTPAARRTAASNSCSNNARRAGRTRCANEQGRGNATVTGDVTPTRDDLKGQLHGQHAQAGAYTLAWTWRGKRGGDCH
ncbi:hypothetical protein DID99_15410 [Burkholderia sp. Bp8986]|nr:hypothetical protein DID99_15410 [Burkholderia sp. Bp8986]